MKLSMDRRRALSLFVKSIGVTMAGVMAIPMALHSLTPLFKKTDEPLWLKIGSVEDFPLDKVIPTQIKIAEQEGSLNYKTVYVWRKAPLQFVVYSRACTDLGCPLKFDPGSEWFFCPCHGGIFDKEGKRRAGPPNKPMWRYGVRIKEGTLEVNLKSVPPMV